jgi:protein O-GlcNAc transferase
MPSPPASVADRLGDELDRARHLWSIGRREPAAAICHAALAVDPRCGPAWFLLGLSAVLDGQPARAAELLERAVDAGAPPQAQQEFGLLLLRTGRVQEALAVLRQAVAAARHAPEILANLGQALHRAGRVHEAMDCYRQVLEQVPQHTDVRANLAGALKDAGEFQSALAEYQRVLTQSPDDLRTASNLLWTTCHLEELPAAELYARHRELGARFAAPAHRFEAPGAGPDRPLRIGFLSADLRTHAVAFYLLPIWRRLDRRRCTVHAYANQDLSDGMTDELRRLTDSWANVKSLDHDTLARRIRSDRIDVLVDLSGHTAGNRLPVLARRAAPVQATWMYPSTTGVPGVDYLLADEWLAPRGDLDHAFTERVVRLPAASMFEPPRGLPPVRPLPARASGHLTFGSFHRPAKLSRGTLACWSAVLRALPDTRLILAHCDEEATAQALRDQFAGQGVDPRRLSFRPRCPLADYLALHHEVDLALDALGYSGGTTTLHALLMGVPVLSVVGQAMPARQSATILHHAGLGGFVADGRTGLVERAVAWASRLGELDELRQGLRGRLLALPLVVEDRVPRAFERAMHAVWRRWVDGRPPAALSVDSDGGIRWEGA